VPSSNPDTLTPKVERINISINSDIQYMLPFLAGVIVLPVLLCGSEQKEARLGECPHYAACTRMLRGCPQAAGSVCKCATLPYLLDL
jgi:hypothetical protein